MEWCVTTLTIATVLLFELTGNYRVSSISVLDRRKLWRSKVIPYEISRYVWNATAIEESINYFNQLTCVKWKARTTIDSHRPYVIFTPDNLCHSEVGKSNDAVNGQAIYIAEHCSYQQIILHEMYHVMGFYHEMKRFDRDKYVEVLWDNINPAFMKNFEKLSPDATDLLNQEYDVNSTMHYGLFAYASKEDEPTIKLSTDGRELLQAMSLDAQDIEKINMLYDCRDDVVEGWSSWSLFSLCNNTCYKQRSRFCYKHEEESCSNNVDPKDDYVQVEHVKCNLTECRRDGWWSRWSAWQACDVHCGHGKQIRRRACNDPPPRLQGNACTGDKEEAKSCIRGACRRSRYDCEFDNDGLCRWTVTGEWKRIRAGSSTGPSTDVSFLIGFYLLLNDGQSGATRLTISRNVPYRCMLFYYNVASHAEIMVSLDYSFGEEVLQVSSGVTNGWTSGAVRLKQGLNTVVITGNVTVGYLAIDDVFFITKSCSSEHVLGRITSTPITPQVTTTTVSSNYVNELTVVTTTSNNHASSLTHAAQISTKNFTSSTSHISKILANHITASTSIEYATKHLQISTTPVSIPFDRVDTSRGTSLTDDVTVSAIRNHVYTSKYHPKTSTNHVRASTSHDVSSSKPTKDLTNHSSVFSSTNHTMTHEQRRLNTAPSFPKSKSKTTTLVFATSTALSIESTIISIIYLFIYFLL